MRKKPQNRLGVSVLCKGNAKAEVDKPFPQEAELSEKLERLTVLNALLDMDERTWCKKVMTKEC